MVPIHQVPHGDQIPLFEGSHSVEGDLPDLPDRRGRSWIAIDALLHLGDEGTRRGADARVPDHKIHGREDRSMEEPTAAVACDRPEQILLLVAAYEEAAAGRREIGRASGREGETAL